MGLISYFLFIFIGLCSNLCIPCYLVLIALIGILRPETVMSPTNFILYALEYFGYLWLNTHELIHSVKVF